jgi:hypothetical protein
VAIVSAEVATLRERDACLLSAINTSASDTSVLGSFEHIRKQMYAEFYARCEKIVHWKLKLLQKYVGVLNDSLQLVADKCAADIAYSNKMASLARTAAKVIYP